MPNAEYQRRRRRITAEVEKIVKSVDSDSSTSSRKVREHEYDESCDSSYEPDAALSSELDEIDEKLVYYGSSPSDKSYESDKETRSGEITAGHSEELAAWTCRNNSTHSSTNETKKILRKHGFCLPEDAGTLLQSSSTVMTAENTEGTLELYLHTQVNSSPVALDPPTHTVSPDTDSQPSPSKHLPQAETIDDIASYIEATNPVSLSSGQQRKTDASSSVSMDNLDLTKLPMKPTASCMSNDILSERSSNATEKKRAVVIPMPVTPGVKHLQDSESTSSTGHATSSRKVSSGKYAKSSDKANGSRPSRSLSESFSAPVYRKENRPCKRTCDEKKKSVPHSSRSSQPPELCRQIINRPTIKKSSVKRLSGKHPLSSEMKRKRSSSPAIPTAENTTIEDQIKKINSVQEKMLFMLVEIRDMLKSSGNHMEKDSLTDCRITQATTPSELAALEEELKDLVKRQVLCDKIVKIGGENVRDHTKKAMHRTLSNGLMEQMNMKGRNNKIGFANTALYSIIRDAVMKSQSQATESQIAYIIASQLKYAPARRGGGARKNAVQH